MAKTIKTVKGVKYAVMGRSFTEKGARKKAASLRKNVTPRVKVVKVGRRYKVWLGLD